MPKSIFFDLDGTLTDSSEGITKCAQLALACFGIYVPDLSRLNALIGPPLRETFPAYGVPPERTEEAVAIFRSRYNTVGKFENTPYPGVREMLSELSRRKYRLFVATSKPEKTAVEILSHFGLDVFFENICGASMDGSRDSKKAVIAHLLTRTGGIEDVVMVGDTAFDVIGAAAHGIPTLGVSWGFGKAGEMLSAGAAAIADTPEELLKLLSED